MSIFVLVVVSAFCCMHLPPFRVLRVTHFGAFALYAMTRVPEAVLEHINSDRDDILAKPFLVQVGIRVEINHIPVYSEEVVGCYFGFEFKRLFCFSQDTFEALICIFPTLSGFFPKPV